VCSSDLFDETTGYFVVGRESGEIDIWNTRTTHPKKVIKSHKYRASVVSFSNDGTCFFSSSCSENATKIWNAENGELEYEIPESRGPVCRTPDDNIYIIANSKTSGCNNCIRLFDHTQKTLLPDGYESSGFVQVMTEHSHSGLVAVGTASGTIDVWRYSHTGEKPVLEKIAGIMPYQSGEWVLGLQFSQNGEILCSVSRSGKIDEWRTDTMELKRSIPPRLNWVYSPKFLKSNELLAFTGTQENHGMGGGYIELVSFRAERTTVYPSPSNLAVVEFLSPFNTMIAVRNHHPLVIDLSKMETGQTQ
jgi:WD40 repeat protein